MKKRNRKKAPRYPRVMACGCHLSDNVGVRFGPGFKPLCAEHNAPMVGLWFTCQGCGAESVISVHAWNKKRCADCETAKLQPKKGTPRPQNVPTQLPPDDIDYIKTHPFLTSAMLAERIGYSPGICRRYQIQFGIAGKNSNYAPFYLLDLYFRKYIFPALPVCPTDGVFDGLTAGIDSCLVGAFLPVNQAQGLR